jgi:A/G-specific adenine glycosylase
VELLVLFVHLVIIKKLRIGGDFRSRYHCAKMPHVSAPSIPKLEVPRFRRHLLAWFSERKRDLPWRRTRDPYRIWISEMMLQQTRVTAVIPYYENFLVRFPTLRSLARAKVETVTGQWAGLGYYSRARNLHRAAKEIVTRHAGDFPQDHEAALALPGIGHYTAAAVLSIAYEQPLAALDGNVARVLARIGAIRGDLRAPALWRKLQITAQGLLSRQSPGDWNQAMMELGATVCTPNSPRCGECPVAAWCHARKRGLTAMVPQARKKRAVIHVKMAAAVWLDPRGRTLLVRQTNGEGALFSHMWQFPAVETTADAASDLTGYLLRNFQFAVNGNMTTGKTARHTVTFRNIRLIPFLIHVAELPQIEGARTVPLRQIGKLVISNATRKIARAVLAEAARPRVL